jgi:hypothetical protein
MVPRDNPLDMEADHYGVAVAKPSKKEVRAKEALAQLPQFDRKGVALSVH